MPNPNYRKGARAEYIVRGVMEAHGWLVMRAYASKGRFDLLGLAPFGREVALVEVKAGSGRMTPRERVKLIALSKAYCATPVLAHYGQGDVYAWIVIPDGKGDPWFPYDHDPETMDSCW